MPSRLFLVYCLGLQALRNKPLAKKSFWRDNIVKSEKILFMSSIS